MGLVRIHDKSVAEYTASQHPGSVTRRLPSGGYEITWGDTKKRGTPRKSPQGARVRNNRSKRTANRGGGGGGGSARGAPTELMTELAAYTENLIQPFDTPPSGLPHAPALPSGKHKVWVKGTMTVGTAGFGFVCGSMTAANNSTSGDSAAFWTNDTFAGDFVAIPGTPGVTSGSNNSPYPMAAFGSGEDGLLQSRPVTYGIRVKYTGQERLRKGTIIRFQDPDNSSVIGKTKTLCLSYPGVHAETNQASRPWFSAAYIPRRTSELKYADSHIPHAEPDPICIIVQAEPGETFEFEVFYGFEVVGRNITNPTPSAADDGLLSRITASMSDLGQPAMDGLRNLGRAALDRAVKSSIMAASSHLLHMGTQHGLLMIQ